MRFADVQPIDSTASTTEPGDAVATRVCPPRYAAEPADAAGSTWTIPKPVDVDAGHPRWIGRRDILPVSMSTLSFFADDPTLIGRYRRRAGDVGDAWRSLLLGAPPALA